MSKYNIDLAIERGLTDEELTTLNVLYHKLEMFLTRPTMYVNEDEVEDVIHGFEYVLQSVWGFSPDRSKHRYVREYRFKKQWVGRVFKCVKTGEQFTIPSDVKERDFYKVGEGFIDVGRMSAYSRFSGVIEVKGE